MAVFLTCGVASVALDCWATPAFPRDTWSCAFWRRFCPTVILDPTAAPSLPRSFIPPPVARSSRLSATYIASFRTLLGTVYGDLHSHRRAGSDFRFSFKDNDKSFARYADSSDVCYCRRFQHSLRGLGLFLPIAHRLPLPLSIPAHGTLSRFPLEARRFSALSPLTFFLIDLVATSSLVRDSYK